jgi:hypothetical protein
MTIWHGTPDAPAPPQRIAPGRVITLVIGTWPIEPGQHVRVDWVVAGRGGPSHGTAAATWQYNEGGNSLWAAALGPFADGDRVTYMVRGTRGTETVSGGPFAATVKPALYLGWLWHQHQPLYRVSTAGAPEGRLRYPWVRLHAIRDYYSMAALAGRCDVHLTINLTPVLLRQIDDYVTNVATDRPLELSRTPA